MARDNHEQLCWPDYRVLTSTASTRSDIPGAARHWTWSYFIKEESSTVTFNHKLTLTALDNITVDTKLSLESSFFLRGFLINIFSF